MRNYTFNKIRRFNINIAKSVITDGTCKSWKTANIRFIGVVKIKNPNGEIEEFDSNGRLVKIYKESHPSQSIDIVYVSNLSSDANIYAIDYITDGVGRKYDFSYNSNTGLLTKIQTFTADGEHILAGSTSGITGIALDANYYYDDNSNLTTIIYPDLKTSKYGYDSNNRITSAISLNSYKITYSYDSFNRVRSISEYSQDTGLLSGYVAGNTITITPDGSKQVSTNVLSNFSLPNGTKKCSVLSFMSS